MTQSMVHYLAECREADQTDQHHPRLRGAFRYVEMKRIAAGWASSTSCFPTPPGVVNGPLDGKFHMYPKAGSNRRADRERRRQHVYRRRRTHSIPAAAKLLDTKCKVPFEVLDLPIGLRATDAFIDSLRKAAGVSVPENLMTERGQVVDVMTDMHQYFYRKKVALVGDPDHLIALTQFLTDLDMDVLCVVTGTPAGPKFERSIRKLARDRTTVKYGPTADMFFFHQLVKNERPDLIFGNTYAKYIARDEDTPLIRIGFPIYDRVGHQYFPITGYRGALRLLERMLNALLDRQDRDAPEESFELVM